MLNGWLSVLANVHRRRILMALMEHNPQEDTATHVPEGIHVGEAELDVLRVELHHTHLPKLDEVGLIRWKQAENEVVKGPRFDGIRPLLELMDNHADELPDDWV